MKKFFGIIFLVISLTLLSIRVSAHETILDIEYDDCSYSETDDYSKKWHEISGYSCGISFATYSN